MRLTRREREVDLKLNADGSLTIYVQAEAPTDLVRLLTISDIFAALIEARPYRAPMPRHTAYQILCDMDGKLENSLVKAFRNVALTA